MLSNLCSTGAASFNGTSDYIDCGDIGAAKSLAFWFKPLSNVNASTAYQRLFGFNSSYHGISLGASTGSLSGEVLAVIPDGASRTGTTTTFDSSAWHHVCVSWNASSNYFDIYINGILDTDLSANTHTLANWDSFIMGTDNTTGTHFGGYMCNVGIWSAALTQPQIKSIMHKDYASLSASEKTNLVSWWSLDSTADVSTAEGGSNLTNVVLDKEGVLGGELGVNGDFSVSGAVTDTSFSLGWATASGDDANDVSIANGRLTLSTLNDTPDDSTARAYLTNGSSNTNPLVVGQVYKLTFDIVDVSSNTPTLRVYHKNADYEVISSSVGSYSYYIRNTSNTLFLFQLHTDNSHVSISNLSIKPLSGNHGTLS